MVAAALLAGCGSTVQVASTASQGSSDLTGGLGPVDGGQAPAARTGTAGEIRGGGTGAVAVPGGSTGPSPQSPTAGTSSSSSGGTGTVPVTPGAGPVSGRGFTRTTVRIGVGTSSDYNSVAGTFGVKGVGYEGDPNAWFTALVNDLNKHGGLLGRRIELVKHDFSTAQELNDPAAANQGACTTWTQDKPVFAVLLAGFVVEDTLLNCLKKAGTPLVNVGAGLDYPIHYQESYARYPLFFNLAQMTGDLFDRLSIERLVARKFFSPWNTRTGTPGTGSAPARIGLIGFDDRDGAVQQANQKKELARHGLQASTTIQCSRDLTNKISCEQSAVLRFASNGVTHVFGADTTFMNNANQQHYYPRYFLQVQAATFAANEPEAVMNGAMGEGYVPYNDVEAAQYPGDPTPATASCKRLMKDAGQASNDSYTLVLQLSVCDEFRFVADAVRASGSLAPAGLRAGLESLGAKAPSALTFATLLGPGNHAAAAALRDLEYRPSIKTFAYTSTTNYSRTGEK